MKFKLLLLIFSILAVISCISENDDIETINYIQVGNNMPEFEITGLKSPNDLLDKKTLLVFFTTACSDCKREMPFAEYTYLQLESQGLNVITIGRGET